MRQILVLSIVVLVFASVISPASGSVIERYVEVTPSSDQIYDGGEYGSGVFWRPTFPLDDFVLTGPGDTITVTASLSAGSRVVVIAGLEEQESVFSLVGNPGAQRTFYEASWEFLGVEGDLFAPSLLLESNSEGGGIACNFNPVDLTDSFFSFSGIRYSFTILDDPPSTGLPATFRKGVVAVQTQGEIVIAPSTAPVPLPATPILILSGLPALAFVVRKLRREEAGTS